MRKSSLLQVLCIISLTAVCPAAYPDSDGSGGTSGWPPAAQDLKKLQIFYRFSQDLYSAGLDESREQQLRRIQLQDLGTGTMTTDQLLGHFRTSWLAIEREIDQAKRVLLCQEEVLAASPAAKKEVVDLQTELQRMFYEKHMILHSAVLQKRHQFDLDSALWKYGTRSAVPPVFEKRTSHIEPPPGVSVEEARTTLADESLKDFCSTPWEFEFVIPQPDGAVKRYRITL